MDGFTKVEKACLIACGLSLACYTVALVGTIILAIQDLTR